MEDLKLLDLVIKLIHKRLWLKQYYIKNKKLISEKRKERYITDKKNGKHQRYILKTKEKRKEYNDLYRIKNSDKIKDLSDKYFKHNKEKIRIKNKQYYKNNRDKCIKYKKEKRINDPIDRLKNNLRRRLNHAISGNYKNGSAIRDLGCSIEFFRKYIESLWTSGMNWENYCFGGWEIDHIKPLSSFNLLNKEELLKSCHYTNLRPLWRTTEIAMKYGENSSYIGNLNRKY